MRRAQRGLRRCRAGERGVQGSHWGVRTDSCFPTVTFLPVVVPLLDLLCGSLQITAPGLSCGLCPTIMSTAPCSTI